ncbi:uncharacterized protein VTP21DRAFT_4200 [Calcarisporiella thermophila]|uniref:uncharacterized protein n=1 Tax=Calcarisporiella thermophila TaxID=911321 RepID=UPI0037421014
MARSKLSLINYILRIFSEIKGVTEAALRGAIVSLQYMVGIHDGKRMYIDALIVTLFKVFFKHYLPNMRGLFKVFKTCVNALTGVRGKNRIEPVVEKGFKGYWVKEKHDTRDPELVVLFFHGGGYVFGYPLMWLPAYHKWIEKIRQVTGKRTAVLCPEYSLAPEKKFPTQLNQALAAYRYLLVDKGISARHIVPAGDSAGGNLALSLCLKLNEDINNGTPGSLPMPGGLITVSPWCSMALEGPSLKHNDRYDYITYSKISECRDLILESKALYTDPRVSPLHAKSTRGLPPNFVIAGELEGLYDDIQALVEKFKRDGVEVEFWHEPRIHDFPLMEDFPPWKFTTINRGAEKVAQFINRNVLGQE